MLQLELGKVEGRDEMESPPSHPPPTEGKAEHKVEIPRNIPLTGLDIEFVVAYQVSTPQNTYAVLVIMELIFL